MGYFIFLASNSILQKLSYLKGALHELYNYVFFVIHVNDILQPPQLNPWVHMHILISTKCQVYNCLWCILSAWHIFPSLRDTGPIKGTGIFSYQTMVTLGCAQEI